MESNIETIETGYFMVLKSEDGEMFIENKKSFKEVQNRYNEIVDTNTDFVQLIKGKEVPVSVQTSVKLTKNA
jgi:hypothetical protein